MSRTSALAERIRLRILQGQLRAGELLIEPELLTTLGAGRGQLREAMRLLEGQGLLVAGEGGGMRVVAPDARAVAEALEVRAVLEGLCAARAAERCRDGGLDPREVRALDAPRARDPDAAMAADRGFHLALARLADHRAAHDALFRT